MQFIKLVVVAVVLVYYATGCGKDTKVVSGPAPCTLTTVSNGTEISCPGSASQIVYNGVDGTQGQPGVSGATGPQGASGAPGQAATPCTVSQVTGGVAIACNGVSQTVYNGADGSNGTNATSVTTVQFCSGTPTYPSTFTESGICIGGSLYAVYSQNGGFLAYLPPGTYSSDGIGSSCNFTIDTGCHIVGQ